PAMSPAMKVQNVQYRPRFPPLLAPLEGRAAVGMKRDDSECVDACPFRLSCEDKRGSRQHTAPPVGADSSSGEVAASVDGGTHTAAPLRSPHAASRLHDPGTMTSPGAVSSIAVQWDANPESELRPSAAY